MKSEYAAITIPEIELEIPYKSQAGGKSVFDTTATKVPSNFSEVTTIEGVLQRTKTALLQDQDARRLQDPEGAKQIDDFIIKLDSLIALERPFTLVRLALTKCTSHFLFD